jgi:hypothetical protein
MSTMFTPGCRMLLVCVDDACVTAGPSPPESLLERIRGEYLEMPGLCLTPAQACRLWRMSAPDCEAVLGRLIEEGFLARTEHGAFVSATTSRGSFAGHGRRPGPRGT